MHPNLERTSARAASVINREPIADEAFFAQVETFSVNNLSPEIRQHMPRFEMVEITAYVHYLEEQTHVGVAQTGEENLRGLNEACNAIVAQQFGGKAIVSINRQGCRGMMDDTKEAAHNALRERIVPILTDQANRSSAGDVECLERELRRMMVYHAGSTAGPYKTVTDLLTSTDTFLALFGRYSRAIAQAQLSGAAPPRLFLQLTECLEIDLANEFRVFVYGTNITSVSQRCTTVCFEGLEERMTDYMQRIWDVVRALGPHLPPESCAVDVAVMPDRIVVLAVHPFDAVGSFGMFAQEEERQVTGMVHSAKVPFRIVGRQAEDPVALLPGIWAATLRANPPPPSAALPCVIM